MGPNLTFVEVTGEKLVDKEKHNDFVNVIKNGLINLKDDINKMSEDEKRIE